MNTNQDTTPSPPPFDEVIKLAQQFMLNKEWFEAKTIWSVLRTAYPDKAAPWIEGGIAEMSYGDLGQAEILLSHAREKFPNDPNTYLTSAELSIKNKRWDEAEYLLQQAREQLPDKLRVWIKSAECAEHQGNQEQARFFSEKARLCAPDVPAPLIYQAELAMRNSKWELALQHWQTLRNLFPDIPAGYVRAAEAAQQLNRPQEARQLILSQQYGADILDTNLGSNTSRHSCKQSNLVHFLELIWTKTLFNLRSEVHRNYLSYGWWVLEPLLYMVVYYVVFGFLLQRGDENFPAFLLTGLIPWMWFTKTVSASSNSIITEQNLILQVAIPPITLPLINILQATLKQLPIFLLLLGFVWLMGYSPQMHWWALLPVIMVQALLTIVIACTVAAVIPFVRDLSYLVPTGLTFMMFLSGIFYDYKMIAEEWQGLFLLNPMAFLLKCYREILLDGIAPDLITLGWWGAGSAVACVFIVLIYKKLRYIYPRIV